MKAWAILFTGIIFETIADTSLKLSHGFTKWIPSVFVVLGYLSSLILFSISLKTIPLSKAYAVWAGAGIASTTLAGIFFFQEELTRWHLLGIALIFIGVVVINLASQHAE